MSNKSQYPHVICCTQLDVIKPGEDVRKATKDTLFDIKFWPWIDEAGTRDQYFAVAGTTQLFICQTRYEEDPPYKVLRWIDFRHEKYSLNSVAWTKDSTTGKPLLCTAGAIPRHILIIDVETGLTSRTLTGHGRNINDLAISPANTDILASASEDFTIRLWNLHPDYDFQPCVAVLAGDGHRQPVLACSFHQSGHWLISGGMDSAVALWEVPDIPADRPHDREPTVVFHPHFYSAEVHDNLVDCLKFYDNIIISRCSKRQGIDQNDILLWQIDGFDGNKRSTCRPPISTPDRYTRSAFVSDPLALGFRRLLTLDMPDTDRFYHRFGLYHEPNRRPILCMGNQNSTMCFWDMQLLEDEILQSVKELDHDSETQNGSDDSMSGDAEPDSESRTERSTSNLSSARKSRYKTPFEPIKPHHYIRVQAGDGEKFTASTITWSPNGHFLIMVGDQGNMFIMYRDDTG